MHVFYSPSKKVLDYDVNIKIYNKDSKIQTNNLSYNCLISFIKENIKGYVVNIKRQKILLNNKTDHSPINEILLISGNILNNLDLEINQYGEIIKVKNLNDIHELWKEIKFKIEQTYVGNIVSSIIKPIEEKIRDEQLFIQSLNKDPFIHNYFGIIYGKYNNDLYFFEDELDGMSEKKINIKRRNRLSISDQEQIQIDVIGTADIIKDKEEKNISYNIKSNYILTQKKEIRKFSVIQEFFQDDLKKKGLYIDVKPIER